MSNEFPDFMLDLRTYLRAHPLLASLSAQRVFFRIPAAPSGSPFIRIYQAGGGTMPSEAPQEQARVGHEVWGLLDADYTLVRQTIQTLKTIYQDADGVLMGSNTVLLNARLTGSMDSPDPDTGWPRCIATVDLLVSLP